MPTPTKSSMNAPEIKPGDIAAAVRELDTLVKYCRIAAADYRKHPAADDLDRGINESRARAAEARAGGFERIMTLLAGHLINRPSPSTPEAQNAG
jgi:hypothetical protein